MCTYLGNNSIICVLLTFCSSRKIITSTALQNFESKRWDPKVSPQFLSVNGIATDKLYF